MPVKGSTAIQVKLQKLKPEMTIEFLTTKLR